MFIYIYVFFAITNKLVQLKVWHDGILKHQKQQNITMQDVSIFREYVQFSELVQYSKTWCFRLF